MNGSLPLLFTPASQDEFSGVHLGKVLRRLEAESDVSTSDDHSLASEIGGGDRRDRFPLATNEGSERRLHAKLRVDGRLEGLSVR